MSKREVWIFCIIIVLLGACSIAYRVTKVTHFDSIAWRNAEEPAQFLDRRAMMPDVEQMFVQGKFNTSTTTEKLLGHPERTSDDDPNTWYYNLGGEEESSSAPESITWLEIKFEDTGRLISHRTTQELIVPDTSKNPTQ
jgi:hypothetical protein